MKTDPLRTEFDAFWAAYPHRVGLLKAREEYVFARKHASAEEILKGVERYKRIKPEFAEWMHPTNWLKQQRWTDEGETIPAHKPRSKWANWLPREYRNSSES